jgi:hypothetical protein
MDADQFTNSSCRSRTGVSGCFNGAYVATHKNGYVAGADVFLAEQLHIGCFDHCIGGLYCANESFGLNHSECF